MRYIDFIKAEKSIKSEVLAKLLQNGEISLARLLECVEDDSKYDEEIKIQNQKINEAKDLQTKQR